MLLDLLPFGTPIQVAFRKDAFLQSGGWDTTFDGNYDDINSWLKIAQYGDAIILDQYLAYRMVWSDSCHKQLSLEQRCTMNISIKENIYKLVSEKYQTILPTLETIRNYVRLHWYFVGLKQKKILSAFMLSGKVIFCLSAWRLLVKIFYLKNRTM